MKYKKYVFFLFLIMLIGVNKTYAYEEETCYYTEFNKEAMATLIVRTKFGHPRFHGRKGFSEVIVNRAGQDNVENKEGIINWYTNYNGDGLHLNQVYDTSPVANEEGKCPEYLILRTKENYETYGVFATNDLTEAKTFTDASNRTGKYHAWYLQYRTSDGKKTTEEEYYNKLIELDPNTKHTIEIGGTDINGDCNELFGDKNDPESIRYLIDQILEYPKIIVPVLVIIFGIIDFSKAVIAGKEEEMKKAQRTFIKRVVIGVAFFFIPLFIDIIMDLADIVWEGLGYTTC